MTQRDLLVTLQETNKYKDQLLASVSHELRAPLNGNINMVEAAINEEKTPETIKETLLIPALRSSKLLLHIINDMLDMSQIKEKKLRLVFEPRDLEETLRNTAQLVEIQAQKKDLKFQIEIDPYLPKDFMTDHLRLSQIVLNLLTNAVKFTKEGVVTLKAISMNDLNWVKIIVEDSGIGISQENLNKIFRSYTHIEFEDSQKMNPTGVGLGLNIASNLVNLLAPKNHLGISVISALNQGSTFSFILENKELAPVIKPVELPDSVSEKSSSDISFEVAEEFTAVAKAGFMPLQIQKNSTSTSITQEPECLCPKILIVDDNPFNTMAFDTILNSLKITCESVYDGHSAIKKLLNRQEKACGKSCQPYKVVFMDQEMPEMTGSETVKEIKRLQRESLLPMMRIIGCTAHKEKEDVDKFLESGLEQCIFKPISKALIHNILK